MWSALASGVSSLFSSWINYKTAKNEAQAKREMFLAEQEADYDLEAMRASKTSIKDEVIMLVWYSPLVVAWFDPEKAMQWIEFVSGLPLWWQIGAFGIMAASFGLRWYFKQQGLKLKDK